MCEILKVMTGRIKEQKQLEKLLQSNDSEFVAVYGRRRVGKTYLVKEYFKGEFAFWHTGLSPYDRDRKNLLQDQLNAFHHTLLRYGLKETPCPKTWMDAFFLLEQLLETKKQGEKKVVFIDELPWLDTARSRFVPAFENFWNGWAAKRDDILLIVCGSATSWMEDNLINNKGGLYGRITERIHLSPFTLAECKSFYGEAGVKMSLYDIAQSYMVLGGIPYYMKMVDPDLSLAQNIDKLFFAKDAKLGDEFDLLFGSLFINPEQYKSIVRLLATRHSGFTRETISEKTGIENGGGLTRQLKALMASDFIVKYTPFGESTRTPYYRLTDCFCRFWLYFIERKGVTDSNFWMNNLKSPALNAWRGYAFEELCLNHVDGIKKALGVSGVNSEEAQWSVKGDDDKDGTQIDLIIDRADNVVNLCEIKSYNGEFKVTKEYDKKLNNRLNILQEKLPKRKIIHSTLITTEGLVSNEYRDAFQKVVILEDLV